MVKIAIKGKLNLPSDNFDINIRISDGDDVEKLTDKYSMFTVINQKIGDQFIRKQSLKWNLELNQNKNETKNQSIE